MMENKKNALPQYWIVQQDGTELYIKEVIEYLNSYVKIFPYHGTNWKYYGVDGSTDNGGTAYADSIEKFKNNPTLLTLEEFIRLKNSSLEEFPTDNWFVIITEENRTDVKQWFVDAGGSRAALCSVGVHYGISKGSPYGCGRQDFEPTDWICVTTEQFRKNILKKYMNTKKIKGYKFKQGFEKYSNAAANISVTKIYADSLNNSFSHESSAYYKLKEAGVLDIWFEPVYEEEYKIITMGTSKVPIKISKAGIEADGKTYTIQDMLELKKKFESIAIGYRSVEIETFKIGCSTFNVEELNLAIKTYQNL